MHWVGDGFPVRTMFSYDRDAPSFSPFLLLDYAAPAHFPPSKTPRGVGEHPTYETMGEDALLSVPTPDHYLPLLPILALRREGDSMTFPVEGFDGGSMSMLSVLFG